MMNVLKVNFDGDDKMVDLYLTKDPNVFFYRCWTCKKRFDVLDELFEHGKESDHQVDRFQHMSDEWLERNLSPEIKAKIARIKKLRFED